MQEDRASLPFWEGFRVADLQAEDAVVRVQLRRVCC